MNPRSIDYEADYEVQKSVVKRASAIFYLACISATAFIGQVSRTEAFV